MFLDLTLYLFPLRSRRQGDSYDDRFARGIPLLVSGAFPRTVLGPGISLLQRLLELRQHPGIRRAVV